MGALSQLQVGEYIIEKGGSAGHFAIHSDGATSDGTEMSAFVLWGSAPPTPPARRGYTIG
jgi:hypothetical protein